MIVHRSINHPIDPDQYRKHQDTKTMTMFENAGQLGKDLMDSQLKAFAAVNKGFQTIATEAADYTKASMEKGTSAMEQLASSKSLEKAIEVQSSYAKDAYEGFVAQATKMGELYADVAKEAYKPFEKTLAKGK